MKKGDTIESCLETYGHTMGYDLVTARHLAANPPQRIIRIEE